MKTFHHSFPRRRESLLGSVINSSFAFINEIPACAGMTDKENVFINNKLIGNTIRYKFAQSFQP